MKIYRLDDPTPKDGVGLGTTDLLYIQSGSIEGHAALIKAQLPAGYSGMVIVDGVVVTVSGTNYTHTAGHIYQNGVIYTVDALSTILASPAAVPKWKLYEESPLDNPVAFLDSNFYYIDIDLKIKLVVSTDTGTAYNTIRRLSDIQFNAKRELFELLTIPKLPSVDFLTVFFDNTGLGIPYTKYEGFAIATGENGTVDMQGSVALGFNFAGTAVANVRAVGDYLVGTLGALVGKMAHLLTAAESGLPDHQHQFNAYVHPDYINADPTLEGDASGESPRYLTRNTTGVIGGAASAASAHENRQPSRVSIMIMKVSEIS